MKTMKKKLMSICLAVVMMFSLTPMSVSAGIFGPEVAYGSYITVCIPAQQFSSDYVMYENSKDANNNELVFYVAEDDFPVIAEVVTSSGGVTDYEINAYGTTLIDVIDKYNCDLIFGWYPIRCYATVVIKKKPQNNTDSSRSLVDTDPSLSLDQKLQTLEKEIDFPFAYVDLSVYAKELRAYLTGEWDGSDRTGNDLGSYNSHRYVKMRTYYWTAVDLFSGESYSLSANIDYSGYKEVIPTYTNSQDYSLAVSRKNGEIEQWSLLELRDSWKIERVADQYEHIESIVPVGGNNSEKDDCQVIVTTADCDEMQHMYILTPGGEVQRVN